MSPVHSYLRRYTDKRYDVLIRIWEKSVRSSHKFLNDTDIEFFRSIVGEYLPKVELYVVQDDTYKIKAFIGLSETTIEMLFVEPSEQGRGYGSQLLDFATRVKKRYLVDVNEQNEQAYRFYRRKGFRVIGRDELDPWGKHFPILHLRMQ